MFEFAFEGALFALTYNGDKFVLLALLPRRKPRTSANAAALFQPYQQRVLRFPCVVGRWRGFVEGHNTYPLIGARQSREVSSSLRSSVFVFHYATASAESDVRARVRGRIVRVNEQRRQARVVGVVAAPKTAHKLLSCRSISARVIAIYTYIGMQTAANLVCVGSREHQGFVVIVFV